jgi:hypothetical protein
MQQSAFFSIPHKVLDSEAFKNASLPAKILLIYLIKHKNKYGDGFYRSVSSLCDDTGLGHSAVSSAKIELMLNGLISYSKGNNRNGPSKFSLEI